MLKCTERTMFPTIPHKSLSLIKAFNTFFRKNVTGDIYNWPSFNF